MQIYYLIQNNKGEPMDGVLVSDKSVEELQKAINDLRFHAFYGAELIEEIESRGIAKYIHTEGTRITVE